MRPCPWTEVLLACACAAIGVGAISAYDKKYQVLSTIISQDNLWKHLFQESIYYKLDRTYYPWIIDNELLRNESSSDAPKSVKGEPAAPDTETRDIVMPYEFVRKIMANRFVIGSIQDMGLGVLETSYRCLAYKHMVHLITLIRVEIMRKQSQSKASSWSGKSMESVELILMTMGALQFTDKHLLAVLSFFDIYKASSGMPEASKFEYTSRLLKISDTMLEYVQHNCIKKPKTEKEVAIELGVYVVSGLFITSDSFEISSVDFKKMIVSSRELIQKMFGSSPRIDGMSESIWRDILHYQENLKL